MLKLERFHVANIENVKAEMRKLIRPFDLDKTPLIRAWLFESSDSQFIGIDMHHIIADGFSMQILF